MKVLAIDTSSPNCSIAILEDENVLKKVENRSEKEHSETLIPMIKDTLDELNLNVKDMDLLACGIGPGSFTGIRIGIATIKAFADANDTPCVGVNSLEAQAYQIILKNGEEDCKILSMIDAKNGNAYFAVYRMHNGNFSLYKNPCIYPIPDCVEFLNFQEKVYIVGDVPREKIETFIDAKSAREKAQGREVKEHCYVDISNNLALPIAMCALNRNEKGIYGDSNSIFPMYLRKTQAEMQREKKNDSNSMRDFLSINSKDIEDILSNYDKFENSWSTDAFEEDTKNSTYIVAKQNSEVVGFISYREVLDEVEIMNLVTRKDMRNQGVASDLISYVVRKTHCNKINLEVNENNITARRLYKEFGFVQNGLRKNYYNNTDDAILMSL